MLSLHSLNRIDRWDLYEFAINPESFFWGGGWINWEKSSRNSFIHSSGQTVKYFVNSEFVFKNVFHNQGIQSLALITCAQIGPCAADKFSYQSDRKRLIFGHFGRRNKFNSHLGRMRSLPKKSILVTVHARSKRWIWRAAVNIHFL